MHLILTFEGCVRIPGGPHLRDEERRPADRVADDDSHGQFHRLCLRLGQLMLLLGKSSSRCSRHPTDVIYPGIVLNASRLPVTSQIVREPAAFLANKFVSSSSNFSS